MMEGVEEVLVKRSEGVNIHKQDCQIGCCKMIEHGRE